MIFQRLRVFVSSKRELAPERQALKVVFDALSVDAWVFEDDLAHGRYPFIKSSCFVMAK
jgi:hypothetical protein